MNILLVETNKFMPTSANTQPPHYMVEFNPSPYNLQENKTIDGKSIEYVELVSNGR